jgi:sortase A
MASQAARRRRIFGRRPGPVRAALRFIASVMIVSGLLLITDAVVTLVWQEPVSAFLAGREQAGLERQLKQPPARVLRKAPLQGDAIGKIELPTLGRSYFMVEGTDAANLRKGPGHYPDTPLPGERGTTAIAGHRTTYLAPFRTIDELKRGDQVVASMPYGRFVYRVETTRIVKPTDLWVKRRKRYDRLILTACHPLYSAARRIVVFARFARRQAPRLARA